MSKKILVSGVQSSGMLHIGNYFGAVRQNIELGNSGEYESYIFIADYHSMTSLINKDARLSNIIDAACTYLALGLDPEKVIFFKQSDVVEHTELAWILNTVTPMPMLELAHSYKDKKAQGADINVGLFTYPVLMAADILMYGASVVPVGRDQEQHLEITRELAGKYNRAYKVERFFMPQAYIMRDVATVPGIDGRKMSKSYNNHIPLFASDEEIQKRVMSIVTDSARPEDTKNPDENNIYNIHKLFLNEEGDRLLRSKFENGGYGYKEAKEALYKAIITFITPAREKYEYYQNHKEEVLEILKTGAEKAKAKAVSQMERVRQDTGLDF